MADDNHLSEPPDVSSNEEDSVARILKQRQELARIRMLRMSSPTPAIVCCTLCCMWLAVSLSFVLIWFVPTRDVAELLSEHKVFYEDWTS